GDRHARRRALAPRLRRGVAPCRRRRASICGSITPERIVMFSLTTAEWAWDGLRLLAVPALVALNAFFVASEFALVAVRKTRVEELVRQGAGGAKVRPGGHD